MPCHKKCISMIYFVRNASKRYVCYVSCDLSIFKLVNKGCSIRINTFSTYIKLTLGKEQQAGLRNEIQLLQAWI